MPEIAGIASPFERLLQYQRVQRELRPHLDVYERDVLTYLVDNTIGYGRDWLKVTVDQMVAGTDWLPSIGVARRTLFKALDRLKARGLIIVKKLKRRVSCFIVNLPEGDMGLKISKKKLAAMEAGEELNPGANETESGLKFSAARALKGEVQCRSGTPKNDSRQETDSTGAAAPRPSLSADEAIRSVKERKRPPRKEGPIHVRDLWKDAWVEAQFGTIPPALTGKECGMLGHARKRFPAYGDDLVRWSIVNWREIVFAEFSWMTDPKRYPEPQFLLTHIHTFAEAYAKRHRSEQLRLLPKEEREYHKLRDRGLSHDDTMVEIGKRRARSDDREQIARDRKAVDLAYRALERERAVSRAMPVQVPEHMRQQPKDTGPVNHGDNPWENGGGDLPDFSDLGEWDE